MPREGMALQHATPPGPAPPWQPTPCGLPLGLCARASLRGEGYLGDGFWRGDNGTDEGSGGLGGAVSSGAGAVQHKVLLNPGCQILIPARLGGKSRGCSERGGEQHKRKLTEHPSPMMQKA